MQLSKFKDILQQQKEEITIFIKNHHQDIDHQGDEIDLIQAKILFRNAAQVVALKKERAAKIDLAIQKIEKNEYGNCEECDEEIPEKRLMINPSFNLCVHCAEANELLKKKK